METMQIGLLIISVLMLIFVIYEVRKNKMNIHYSVIWIIWGSFLIILSLFPSLLNTIASILSITAPVNAVFLIMIFLLYCLTFYIYLKISKHNEEIITLNYEIASLKKRIEDKDKK